MSSRRGRLHGTSVAVTGAASGIGRATIRRAVEEGATAFAIDRDEAGLAALREELGVAIGVTTADVADRASVVAALDAASEHNGGLDVVWANAGIGMDPIPVMDVDAALWQSIIDINLSGVFHTLQAAVPHLRRRGGGLLLATGSSTAIRPGQGLLPYVAAKAGVHVLVRSLAVELAREGIRAVVLAPGLTETPMTSSREGYIERGLAAVPMGRVVTTDEIAAMAVHLMSDDARSVTGTTVVVDAGRTAV